MKFCIELGEAKKHQIVYEFNELLGRLVIKFNQQEIQRRVRWFNEPRKETHILHLPAHLTVRIEKERRPLGSKCLVFINERLFRCYEGV